MIVIVFGLPGSGKSYFASKLAEKLDADYINTDKVRKELFTKPNYSDAERVLIYKKILNEVYHHAHGKRGLVVDGTFYQENIREDFNKLARDLNIDLYWIEINADEQLIKKRVAKKRDFSDADYSVYQLLKRRYDPFVGDDYLQLNSTDDNIDQMIDESLRYLTVH